MMAPGVGRRAGVRSLPALLSFLVVAAVALAPWMVLGQARAPGLTGADRPDDVIQARQLLMDGVETEMNVIELATDAGRKFEFADLQSRAYMISTLLTVLPHLFPPETKPSVGADGTPSATVASSAIWDDFDRFYANAQAASEAALQASQAPDMDRYRARAARLREACDSCHATYMVYLSRRRADQSQPAELRFLLTRRSGFGL